MNIPKYHVPFQEKFTIVKTINNNNIFNTYTL